jgi:hypothetical protein
LPEFEDPNDQKVVDFLAGDYDPIVRIQQFFADQHDQDREPNPVQGPVG